MELHIQFRLGVDESQNEAKESVGDMKVQANCGNFDLSDYLNAWESLPPINPPAPIEI